MPHVRSALVMCPVSNDINIYRFSFISFFFFLIHSLNRQKIIICKLALTMTVYPLSYIK